MSNKLLYIGLNGYAGAGKDTVAKMLYTILNRYDWTLEEYKEYYKKQFTDPTKSATFNSYDWFENNSVLCIAYADQLKEICSTMFGIPVERFYMNKANAWICISDKFQYTEIKPSEDHIMTAEEYYYGGYTSISSMDNAKYWMSLREILVYVGTYVLQQTINKDIFVNIVRNKIKEEQLRNPFLKYVIVTDNRFSHEIDYIHDNNGITIKIVRDSIQQLNNIAEHDLDEEQNYDYIIDNSGSYDELLETIYGIVHSDIEFSNTVVDLYTRDNIDNYLRLVAKDNKASVYMLCAPLGMQELYGSGENYTAINPIGGPMICVGKPIDGTRTKDNSQGLIPSKIKYNEETATYYIYIEKEEH